MSFARPLTRIGFLGFGEAGQAFASGLQQENPGLDLMAYDIKLGTASLRQGKQAEMTALNVGPCARAVDLAAANVVFSMVTANQAGRAARALAEVDLTGVLVLDCNSCAPETKRANADAISAAGGAYVDMAVMAPVHPRLHKTPCLLSGPAAEQAAQALNALTMAVSVTDGQVGAASTRKMVRSIMIKGIEALTVECMISARKAGIEDIALASLEDTFPGMNWGKRAPYMLERAMTHGVRRAAEMREVAQTVRDLGFEAPMALATVARQQEIGDLGLNAQQIGANDLGALADAIISALSDRKT